MMRISSERTSKFAENLNSDLDPILRRHEINARGYTGTFELMLEIDIFQEVLLDVVGFVCG